MQIRKNDSLTQFKMREIRISPEITCEIFRKRVADASNEIMKIGGDNVLVIHPERKPLGKGFFMDKFGDYRFRIDNETYKKPITLISHLQEKLFGKDIQVKRGAHTVIGQAVFPKEMVERVKIIDGHTNNKWASGDFAPEQFDFDV